MIIIVEGIDRVGKSTLCKMIEKELKISVHKYNGIVPYNKMKNIEETDKILNSLQLVEELKGNIIFDRLYFTDYVYGILERNYDVIEASKNFEKIDSKISNINDVFLIYVLPIDIEKSSIEHGKSLEKHNKLFYDLFKESKIKNKFRCDYNTLNEAILFINSKRSEKNE